MIIHTHKFHFISVLIINLIHFCIFPPNFIFEKINKHVHVKFFHIPYIKDSLHNAFVICKKSLHPIVKLFLSFSHLFSTPLSECTRVDPTGSVYMFICFWYLATTNNSTMSNLVGVYLLILIPNSDVWESSQPHQAIVSTLPLPTWRWHQIS